MYVAGSASSPVQLAVRAAGVGVYSSLVTPPLFWLLRRMHRLVGMVESFRIG